MAPLNLASTEDAVSDQSGGMCSRLPCISSRDEYSLIQQDAYDTFEKYSPRYFVLQEQLTVPAIRL